MLINLIINEEEKSLEVEPNELLIDALRRNGYKGTKKGCGHGTCGACTVLMDGKPILACMTFAAQAAGHEIFTVEGLGTVTEPSEMQQIFVEHGAVQCGYCTPGMLLATKALLEANANPSEEEIKRALDGNLCRCTGYVKIIEAIKDVAAHQKNN